MNASLRKWYMGLSKKEQIGFNQQQRDGRVPGRGNHRILMETADVFQMNTEGEGSMERIEALSQRAR